MEELTRAIIINNILVVGFILIQAAIMYAFISMPKDVSDQLQHVKDHQRWQDDEKQKLMHRCRALEDKLAEIEKWLPEETEEESALKKYLCKVQDAATRLVKDLGFKEEEK